MVKKRKQNLEEVRPEGEAVEPINPGSSPAPSLPEVAAQETASPAVTIAPPRHGKGMKPTGEASSAKDTGHSVVAASLPEADPVKAAMALAQQVMEAGPLMPREREGVGGRPTLFNDEMAAAICTRLSVGESLRAICRDEDMPHISTVIGWVFRNPEFFSQYRAAREMQAEIMADEMKDIADDGSNDWMERHNSKGEFVGWMENGEAIRRSQLRINTRQWVASRLLPKRYGDKTQQVIQNPDGTPVNGLSIDPRSLTPEVREALKAALTAAMRQNAQDIDYTEET